MKSLNSEKKNSSKHPWYYAPGNKYLSEQRLSAKYESDSKKKLQNDKLNKYYNKCKQETKLFSNWDQNKPLVKYKKIENLEIPFRIEKNEIQIENENKIYNEYLENIRKHFNEYKMAASNFKNSFIDSSAAINYLLQQIELYEDIKKTRKNFFVNWRRYFANTCYNYNNDPLRQVCFQIKDLLYFYRSIVTDNLNRLKKLYSNKFFSEPEQEELQELNKRCLQIIEMYLNLNDMRDHHFQNMFYEERESHWLKQKLQWKEEMEVWDSLFVKLFDSNYLLIRNRIEEIFDKQRLSLKKRLEKLEQLKKFIKESSDIEQCKPILHIDIEQLKT